MSNPTIQAYQPLTEQGLYAENFQEDLTLNHEGWTHTISAVGGFDTAKFKLKGDLNYLQDWFEDGLMRRVVFYDSESVQTWEGFVSRLDFSYGSAKKTRAIDNVQNRVYLYYTPVIYIGGNPIETIPIHLTLDDAPSQDKYGIKAAVVNAGARTDEEAVDWAKTVLKFNANPQRGSSPISILGGSEPYIDITLLGYYHTLKWIPYFNSNYTPIRAHQVIIEVLQYFNTINPGWIDQSFTWMDFNTRLQQRGYNSLKSCWDVIEEVINNGGPAGTRWVGGLYQDRRFIYKQAEDFDGLYGEYSELIRSITGRDLLIYDGDTGAEVKFWNVYPDRLLRTVDDFGDNTEYIEQVTYSEPYNLQITGGDDQRLKIYLAQKGLSL